MKNHLIKLYSVDFGLPFQGFYFDYKVTANQQMPILRELVLRLLKIGDLDVSEIQIFLGLSELETNALARMLVGDDEATITQQQLLQLTGKGLSYFKGAIEDIPSVTQIDEYQDVVQFDLINFEALERGQDQLVYGAEIDSVIPISANPEVLSKSIQYARDNFVRGFHQLFHDLRKDNYAQPKNPHIFKITNCEPRRQGYLRRSVDVMFDLESREVSEQWDSELESSWQDPIGRKQGELGKASNLKSIRDFFERVEYVKGLYACAEKSFNANKYLTDDGREYNRPFRPFIGTISDVIEDITSVIRKSEYESLEFKWFAPNVAIWGKSDSLRSTISSLLNPTEKNTAPQNRSIKIEIPDDGSKHLGRVKQLMNRLSGTNEQLKVTKSLSDDRDDNIEVLFVNRFLVVVVAYLYRESEHWPIPIGFLSEDKCVINALIDEVKTAERSEK